MANCFIFFVELAWLGLMTDDMTVSFVSVPVPDVFPLILNFSFEVNLFWKLGQKWGNEVRVLPHIICIINIYKKNWIELTTS